jgi:hypothetical protein
MTNRMLDDQYAVGDVVDPADILDIHSCSASEDGTELVFLYDLKNCDLTGVATYSPAHGMSEVRAH